MIIGKHGEFKNLPVTWEKKCDFSNRPFSGFFHPLKGNINMSICQSKKDVIWIH